MVPFGKSHTPSIALFHPARIASGQFNATTREYGEENLRRDEVPSMVSESGSIARRQKVVTLIWRS